MKKISYMVQAEPEDQGRGTDKLPAWCKQKRCYVGVRCLESEETELCNKDMRFRPEQLARAMQISIGEAEKKVKRYG